MTPPIWLAAAGRPRPTRACWTCGREVAPMRFRASDLRPHGWQPCQTLHIPDWCGCTMEYLPVPAGDGWWDMVPIWDPSQTVNPLRRYGPPERAEDRRWGSGRLGRSRWPTVTLTLASAIAEARLSAVGSEAEMSETVSFVQIVTAVTHQGTLLYGLTTSGVVYEYNFSREVWIPLPMRALPEGSPGDINVVGLRGPGGTMESEPGKR